MKAILSERLWTFLDDGTIAWWVAQVAPLNNRVIYHSHAVSFRSKTFRRWPNSPTPAQANDNISVWPSDWVGAIIALSIQFWCWLDELQRHCLYCLLSVIKIENARNQEKGVSNIYNFAYFACVLTSSNFFPFLLKFHVAFIVSYYKRATVVIFQSDVLVLKQTTPRIMPISRIYVLLWSSAISFIVSLALSSLISRPGSYPELQKNESFPLS